MDSDKTLGELVRKNEQDYIAGNTTISKYVNFSLSENINKIDAYLNSKHISGDTDSMGREKPFFNIVTAAVNIWYRATDIDRKDIKVKATKTSNIFTAFLASVLLQNWMTRENFGNFLNDWGRTLARYGSAVVKFIESEGKLHSMVVPWNRLIVDQVDFNNDVVIEVLELSPADLRNRKGYDKEIVDKLIKSTVARETTDKVKKDNKTSFIKLYEVHGEMPLSYLTGKDSDDDTFVQQMHVISYLESKEKGEYDDYCLIKGREEKNPYMITHLIKEDGRTQSIGAVENLFEAQWMLNHTKKQIKDQLDLASKLIFQTSDGNFVGQNALSSIENGDILIHGVNQPLTQLANNSHDITALQNFGAEWKALGTEINGISESMMGNAAPSGTAWRQVEALLNESHSLFEMMVENKGIHIEEMLRTYVIPYLKKQMDNSEEITAVLQQYDIERIDKKYVPYEATKRLAKRLIEHIITTGEIPEVTQDMKNQVQSEVTQELDAQGNQRFFKPSELDDTTWKELLKDIEWELEIDVTGEGSDNKADMATLSTVLQTLATNPGMLNDPKANLLFNKILMKTATVSPMELSALNSTSAPNPIPPQTSTAPSGGAGVGVDMSSLMTK
jgi:hypothetical protein